MMLLKIIKNKNIFLKNIDLIKKLILFTAFISLYNIKPKTDKVFSDQFLHEFLVLSKTIVLDYKNINDFDFVNKQFKIGNNSCANTILIEGELKNIVQLLTIYTTLKEAKYLKRDIIIKVKENNFYKIYGKYFQDNELFAKFKKRWLFESVKQNDNNKIILNKSLYHKLKLQYKNVIKKRINRIKKKNSLVKEILNYTKKKLFKTSDSNYFAVLHIKFSSRTYLCIDVLKNYMPNSDFLFVAKYFFDSKLEYNLTNAFFTDWNINTLKITSESDIKSFKKIITLIRCINNIHSYSLGNYYYIPFYETHVTLLQIFPFILVIFTYFAFDYIFSTYDESINFGMLVVSVFYLFCPIILILQIIFGKNTPAKNCYFVLFFTIVNFRFGMIFTLYLFITRLNSVIKHKK